MSIEEKYEQYESYLDGSMSADEKNIFETNLKDKNFKQEFDEYCSINAQFSQMIQHEEKEKAFISNLKHIAKDYSNGNLEETVSKQEEANKTKLGFSKNIKWILSAAAILLLGFFSYLQFYSPPKSMQELYASNYSPEELSIERGNSNDSLEKIVTLYQAKNYSDALQILTPYSKLHPEQENLRIAIAICQIETQQYADAEKELSSIVSLNDIYKEKAQWYLAMLYLKQGQREKCIALLQSFNSSHFYFPKATVLLKQLQ